MMNPRSLYPVAGGIVSPLGVREGKRLSVGLRLAKEEA
jgi:hypothetical protein